MTWQQCKLVTACYVLNHSKWSNKWSKHSTNGTSLDDKFANLFAQGSIFFQTISEDVRSNPEFYAKEGLVALARIVIC